MHLLDLIAAMIFVVPFAWLHMRCFQLWFLKHYQPQTILLAIASPFLIWFWSPFAGGQTLGIFG